MQQHLPHLIDACIVGTISIVTAASTVLLNEAPQTSIERMEMMLLLLPLIGAAFATGGCIMLNPQTEERRFTIGRGLFALFFGALSPQVVTWFWPSLAGYNVKPVFLLVTGALVAFIVFVLIKAVATQFFKRSDAIGAGLADQAFKRLPSADVDAEKPTQRL